jgi:multicomponent Na+:H+ antiporter subunit D
VLLNALLSLIAGARLWAHIFWRAGHDGAGSELPNPDLRPLGRRARRLGLVPAALLTLLVLALGLFPEPLLAFARAGAKGLLEPAGYIAATGLAEVAP